MSSNIYDLANRVRYSDFLLGARQSVAAMVRRAGAPVTPQFQVQTHPNLSNPASAAVDVTRLGRGEVHEVDLYMPVIDPEANISGELARDILAFVVHEIGHILWTNTAVQLANDQPLVQTVQQHLGIPVREAQSLVHGLQGTIEDYFLENKASDPAAPIASGAARLLGDLNAQVMVGADQGATDPNPLRAAAAYVMSQIDRHGKQGRPELVQLAKDGQQAAPQAIREIIDPILNEMDQDATKTANPAQLQGETHRRAGKVRAALKKLVQVQMPPEAQQQQSEGQSQGQGQGQGEGQGQGQGEGQDQDQDQGHADQNGEPKPNKSGKAAAPAGDKDERMKAKIAAESPGRYSKANELAMVLDSINPGLGSRDKSAAVRTGSRSNAEWAARHADTRRFADAARRALYSPDTVTPSRRLQTGRMDRRAITRAAVGSLDVFTRKRMDQGQRTAVVVMIDGSGSMTNLVTVAGRPMSRLEAVNGTAAAIIPAVQRAGAEIAVGLFNGGRLPIQLKSWRDRYVAPDQWLSDHGNLGPSGGTPMLESFFWAENQLKTRTKATRKVCVWLCDGAPNEGHELMHRWMGTHRSGIEHIGIGIQIDLCDRAATGFPLFPKGYAIKVDDLSQLARAFERAMFDMGDRAHRLANGRAA